MGYSKKTIYILLIGLLWTIPSWAESPGDDYPCFVSNYKENLKNAKFIFVAKLEKYLPDHKGEYRVLMNLRGKIQPGEKFIGKAKHKLPKSDELMLNYDPLGYNYIFLGEDYSEEKNGWSITHYLCDGRFGIGPKINNSYSVLGPVIDYILETE